MADEEQELDPVTGNPVSQPEKSDDERTVDKHKHIWQGMRMAGVRTQMCAECGKSRKVEDE